MISNGLYRNWVLEKALEGAAIFQYYDLEKPPRWLSRIFYCYIFNLLEDWRSNPVSQRLLFYF